MANNLYGSKIGFGGKTSKPKRKSKLGKKIGTGLTMYGFTPDTVFGAIDLAGELLKLGMKQGGKVSKYRGCGSAMRGQGAVMKKQKGK